MNGHSDSTDFNPESLLAAASLEARKKALMTHLARRQPQALQAALPVLNAAPTDADVLLMAAIAALLDERPEQSLRYLQRFTKRYSPLAAEDQLLCLIALAQQGIWTQAAQALARFDNPTLNESVQQLPCGNDLVPWINEWLRKIRQEDFRRSYGPLIDQFKAGREARTRSRKPDKAEKKSPAAVEQKTSAPAAGKRGVALVLCACF